MAGKKTKFQESIERLNELLKRDEKDFPKFFVSISSEDYFVYKIEQLFKEKLLKHPDLEGVEIVDGASLKPVDLRRILFEKDMFQPQKLVQIRKAEKIKFLSDFLQSHIDDLTDCVHTVHFSFLGKELPKKHPLAKEETLVLEAPYSNEIPSYITSLAKSRGVVIKPQEAQLLSLNFGHDLSLLENEVRLIALINHDGKGLKRYLSSDSGYGKAEPAFKLVDMILENSQNSSALALLHSLLREGVSGLSIVGVLTRHCRLALTVLDAKVSDSQAYEFSRKLRVPLFQMKKYQTYAAKMGKIRLKRALAVLGRADFSLKSSRVNEFDLLTTCVQAQS